MLRGDAVDAAFIVIRTEKAGAERVVAPEYTPIVVDKRNREREAHQRLMVRVVDYLVNAVIVCVFVDPDLEQLANCDTARQQKKRQCYPE